jgi:hypothetical protein
VLLPTAAQCNEHGYSSLFTLLEKTMPNRKGGRDPRTGGHGRSLKTDYFAYVFVFLGNIIDNSLLICRFVILVTTLCVLLPFLSLCRSAFVWGPEIFLPGPEPSVSGPGDIQKINNSVRTHINLYGLIPDILQEYLRIKTHS